MKIVVYPRNDANPYLDLLFGEIRSQGDDVRFLATPTWSQTANVLLIPLLLGIYRLRGFRLLHIHWTYLFAPVWVPVVPFGRSIMEAWFAICLRAARLFGIHVVWTAHNLLPLGQVFADDLRARKTLLRAADAVIAHNASSVEPLRAMGAKDVALIRFGPYGSHYPKTMDRAEARERLGLAADERVVAFVGAIENYKGVDTLLEAVADLPQQVKVRVVIAGRCHNHALRHRLEELAERAGPRVRTFFGYIPDDELQVYFASADAVALPFRHITNSSSLLLALEFGVPVILPDLPQLEEIPERASLRYRAEGPTLPELLAQVATMDGRRLEEMGADGKAFVAEWSWERSARETRGVYASVFAG